MIVRSCVTAICLLASHTVFADDPPKPQEKAPADSNRPRSPLDAELLKALEKQSAPEHADESPLIRIGQRMRDVQGRLVKADPGSETQTIQQGIVEDIDKLIEQMKKGGG